MLFIFNTRLISIFATHIPVSSIVAGDIHLPRELIAVFINGGICNPLKPITIPISIAIKSGFKRFLGLKPLPFSFGIRSPGTAQE